jgi:hypothetical protein
MRNQKMAKTAMFTTQVNFLPYPSILPSPPPRSLRLNSPSSVNLPLLRVPPSASISSVCTRCARFLGDQPSELERRAVALDSEPDEQGVRQHLAQQAIGQVPAIARPDPLDRTALGQLAKDGVDAVAHPRQPRTLPRMGVARGVAVGGSPPARPTGPPASATSHGGRRSTSPSFPPPDRRPPPTSSSWMVLAASSNGVITPGQPRRMWTRKPAKIRRVRWS